MAVAVATIIGRRVWRDGWTWCWGVYVFTVRNFSVGNFRVGNFTVENFTVETFQLETLQWETLQLKTLQWGTFQCEWGRKLLMFSAPLVCQRSSQGYFHHFRSVLLSGKYQENISKIIQTSSREALVRFPNPLASGIHGSWGAWLGKPLLQNRWLFEPSKG